MSSYQKLVSDFRKAMFLDHDPAAVARCYTDDAVLTDPGHPEPIRGAKAIGDYHGIFLRAFPDLSGEPLNVFGSGEWFAAEFRVTGTHTGPLEVEPGEVIPPTGRKLDLNVCWIGRVAPDGRCSEDHSYYDTLVFAELAKGAPA
jgi:ketosteroid isomerase-like protein